MEEVEEVEKKERVVNVWVWVGDERERDCGYAVRCIPELCPPSSRHCRRPRRGLDPARCHLHRVLILARCRLRYHLRRCHYCDQTSFRLDPNWQSAAATAVRIVPGRTVIPPVGQNRYLYVGRYGRARNPVYGRR